MAERTGSPDSPSKTGSPSKIGPPSRGASLDRLSKRTTSSSVRMSKRTTTGTPDHAVSDGKAVKGLSTGATVEVERSCLGSLKGVLLPLIEDVVLSIQLPQELIVTNPRICIIYKIIQVASLIGLGIYMYLYRLWSVTLPPKPYLFSAWPEVASEEIIELGSSERHCTDVESYYHTYYGTATYEYRPRDCRVLNWGDGWIKKPDSVIIFTYVTEGDEYRSNNRTGECLTAADACDRAGASFVLDRGSCRCVRADDFFVKNVEMTILHFFHGYQVQKPGGELEKGSASKSEDNITTHIRKADGSSCQINGQSKFLPGEIGPQGLFATLKQWLACAGASLDSEPSELGNSDPSLVTVRMMGSRLVFRMHYTNQVEEGVQCYITPELVPAWTTVYQSIITANDMSIGHTEYHLRFRTGYGLQIQFQVDGDMRYFDIDSLITGLVNVLFLASVPRFIIQVLCCYFLGAMSGIYRNAKRTPFSVNEQMRTAVARALMPMMIFKGLIGGKYGQQAEELSLLDARDIRRITTDIHAEEVADGRLEDRHINRMVMMLCGALTGEAKEQLDANDLRVLQNANDVITADLLVNMLHFRRKRGFLEKLMDDTDQTLDAQVFASLLQGQKRGRGDSAKQKLEILEADETPIKKGEDDHTKIKKLLNEVEELRARTKKAEDAIVQANSTTGLAQSKVYAASERAELSDLLADQQRTLDNEDRMKRNHRHAGRDHVEKGEHKLRKGVQSQREAASTIEGRLLQIETRTRQATSNLEAARLRQEELAASLELMRGRTEMEDNTIRVGPQTLR